MRNWCEYKKIIFFLLLLIRVCNKFFKKVFPFLNQNNFVKKVTKLNQNYDDFDLITNKFICHDLIKFENKHWVEWVCFFQILNL